MKKWFEYYSMTQMYNDWKKNAKPKQFVESLPEKVLKYWDQYFTLMNDISGINIVFLDIVHKYHQDHGNIKPLSMGRGPLPGMQSQPVAESIQPELTQAGSRMNKTIHSRPQYQKYLIQMLDAYRNKKYTDEQILSDMSDGSLYIENPNIGMSRFIKLIAQHGISFEKLQNNALFIAKKIYQMLQNRNNHRLGQYTFDQIRDKLLIYLNQEYGEDYMNTKDLRD